MDDLSIPRTSDSGCADQINTPIEVEIAAGGDVIIICRTVRMRVASENLSISSPFFKTMFESKFREGTFQRSISSPLEVDLSEDNGEALEVVLKLMHFSNEHLLPEIEFGEVLKSLRLLENVMMLAKQYLCKHITYSMAELWMNVLDPLCTELQDLDVIARISYMRKDHERFLSSTTRMLNTQKACDLHLISSRTLQCQLVLCSALAQADSSFRHAAGKVDTAGGR